ncbi:hypothetical protein QLX67_13125, partial [Balneolaceae bacterium ANBcel3]|nr:hypothetical protein [Balneolaceae bacterium ANBcel3]
MNTVLTTRTTLRLDGDFNIGVDAEVILGLEGSGDHAVHIRMQDDGTFTNEGGYTSPEDVRGFLIIQDGAIVTLDGDGVFGNLDIREGSATLADEILFSGILIVAVDGELDLDGNDLTITDTFIAVSDVTVDAEGNGVTGAGSFAVAGDAMYDLLVHGDLDGDDYVADQEIAEEGIRHLTISTESDVVEYTVAASEVTIAGVLTIGDDAVFEIIEADSEFVVVTNNLVHTIGGGLDGRLVVDATGVEVNGTEDGESTLFILEVEEDASVTSNGLKEIGDVIVYGDAVVTMSDDDAMGWLPSIIGGDIEVHSGSLTLDLGDDDRVVDGSVTIFDGDLILASNMIVDGTTDQDDGNLVLGAYNYQNNDKFTHTGSGEIQATTGYLVLNDDLETENDLTIVNLYVINDVFISDIDDADKVTVTNSLRQDEDIDLSGLELVLTGVNYLYESGSIDGTFVFEGVNLTLDAAPTFDDLVVDGYLNLIQGGVDSDVEQNVTVGGTFTHTSGVITLGVTEGADDNTLRITAEYVREGGSYVANDGFLIWDNDDVTVGEGLVVPNLAVEGTVNLQDDEAFTVSQSLV